MAALWLGAATRSSALDCDSDVQFVTGQPSLQRQVIVGAGWLGAARLIAQVVQFGSGLVLARLLSPADFGVVASVNVIAGFGVLLFEGGLRAALVHAREPNQRDMSTVFWLNIAGGIVLAGLLFAGAPAIAGFYHQPVLSSIAPIVGLAFACSTGVVNAALLQRELRFRASAVLESGATIIGLMVTLILALAGWGPFALAIGPVVAQILVSIGYSLLRPWRPSLIVSMRSIVKLGRFSAPLLGATVAEYWGRNVDTLLIGRFLGATPLGFYSRAYNLMLLPLTQITQSVGSAVSPALSRLRDEPARVGPAFARSLTLISYLTITIMVGLAATAPALVDVLWGSRWDATVPLLQVLALAGIPQCIHMTLTWVYQSQERTATMMKMTLIFNVLSTALMCIGLQWGVLGVTLAVFARYWLGLPIELYVAIRSIGLDYRRLLASLGMQMLPLAVIGVVAYMLPVALTLPRSSVAALAAQVALGLVLVSINLLVFRRDLVSELLALRRGRI